MTYVDPLDALHLSLRSGATELHLVRHGDAVHESTAAFAVHANYDDHPLSERGRAQAAAVARRFADVRIAALYASPVRRAAETAQAIAERTGLTVSSEPALREVEIGAFAGSGPMSEQLSALAAIAMREGSWESIVGSEPPDVSRERMLTALGAIARRHPGERVGVVSHAGSINAALAAIAQSPSSFVFPLANASVSVIRLNGARRIIMSANETGHLRVSSPAVQS